MRNGGAGSRNKGEGRTLALADDIDALKPNYGGYQCAVTLVLDEMTDEDRAVFTDALGNSRIQSSGLARVLRENGFSVGEGAIRRHRRGDCSCR